MMKYPRSSALMTFLGTAILFITTYQILISFLTQEDGISLTFIANSNPHWAYFFDGYIISYTIVWFQTIISFSFSSPQILMCVKKHTKPIYLFYTLLYNIALYFLGIIILLSALNENIPIRFIPFILCGSIFVILFIVRRNIQSNKNTKK